MRKSTVDEIRARFDTNVERFSNLDTGQSATIDSPLVMELIADSAARVTPHGRALLDIGCGAGNYTLKLLQRLPQLEPTLIDLSRPMLDRACERISAVTTSPITIHQADIREMQFEEVSFDIVLAAAVLHHLRDDRQWRSVFTKIFSALRPGGSFWVFDLVFSDLPGVQAALWNRYAEYLTKLRDKAYCEQVFAYIEEEDTPRSLVYQLELLREVGFQNMSLLHANGPFAALGAVKPES